MAYYALIKQGVPKASIECVDENTPLEVGKYYTGKELYERLGTLYLMFSKPNEKWQFRKFDTIYDWQKATI